MHIVRFKGGLANQLFQLCLYEKLKGEYGYEQVYADISHYRTNHDHGGFKLKKFFKLNYMKRMPSNCIRIDETNYGCVEIDKQDNYLYDAYWQSENYFPRNLGFLDYIFDKMHLSSENRNFLGLIESEHSVSIHVRRGDYVDNFLHGNISNKTYLLNAIDYIKENINNPSFFVFSDDISWCKDNLNITNSEVHYVTGNEKNPETDILLMSRCKHNIIANSSFSWWAQRLNRNPNKTVVAPRYWFNEDNATVALNDDSFIHVDNCPSITEKCNNPKFSIIISTYNDQFRIKRCLSTVLNQTYNNIEVIIVDDASTDNTLSVLRDYEEQDARIKIIRNTNHKSSLVAKLQGLRVAKGEYVFFMGADDYYALDTFEIVEKETRDSSPDIIEFSCCIEPSKKICISEFDGDIRKNILENKYSNEICNKCFNLKNKKLVIENARDFYCDFFDAEYVCLLFAFNAMSYIRINTPLCHHLVRDKIEMYGVKCEEMNSSIIESLINKNEHIMKLAATGEDGLVNSLRMSMDYDVKCLMDLYNKLQMPISERLKYLFVIDDRCGTSYYEAYEKTITLAVKLYKELNNNISIKSRLKFALKYTLRKRKNV